MSYGENGCKAEVGRSYCWGSRNHPSSPLRWDEMGICKGSGVSYWMLVELE